jgi:ribosomal protein S18 acetylase RimI-like enzyme
VNPDYSAGMSAAGDAAARARAWLHGVQAAVCDVFDPWDAGTVVRATRYPSYFDFNVVRIERDPGMSVESLVAFADEALAEHAHRRIDFELTDLAEPLRASFATHGYASERLVWMRHETAGPSVPGGIAVEEVTYDAVHPLRLGWFEEDFPEAQLGAHLAEARDVHLLLGARIFAVLDGGDPVGYAQLERLGRSAEIAQVYVRADHRGRGLGTALTCAAIDAAGDVDELWIVADDEGRPKALYERLGFRSVWTMVELLRLPGNGA